MLVRMAAIKKSTNNAGQGVGEKGTLLVGMQTSTATIENSAEIPWKTGSRTAIWPAFPLLGIHTEETRSEREQVPQCSSQHCLQ